MTTPPALLGAALLFWGWQTGLFFFAVIIAGVLEGSRLVTWRWDLDRSDFSRVADLCTFLSLGMMVYLFATRGASRSPGEPLVITILFTWLPLTFAPLVTAQAYSAQNKIDLTTLFLSLRRKTTIDDNKQRKTITLAYPYFVLCLLSASAANVRTSWFYLGLFVFSGWALWFARARSFSPFLWVTLLFCVGFMGYGGHIALHNLQKIIEEKAIEWLSGSQIDSDPYRSTTAIGDLGSLKLSDRILLRVEANKENRPPILLRDASYDIYNSSTWFATDTAFEAVQPEPDGTTWRLQPGTTLNKDLTISYHLKRGKGILALPNSTLQIKQLPVVRLQRNRLGAVKVDEGPGLITYMVLVGLGPSFDGPPNSTDLRIPLQEAHVLSRMARELRLASQSPRAALKTVADFFQNNFRYSTFLSDRKPGSTPLEDFFLRSRSGHCEYFATATVLLLRAAGIPARYATGYSVQEFSRLENRYIVRARHAHAWTLVHIDGVWQDFDTTPARWIDIEGNAASFWQPVSDLWSWGVFLFSKWRWREGEGKGAKHLGWLLILLTFILAWRLYFKNRVVRFGKYQHKQDDASHSRPGEDSEFYVIEKKLSELGVGRHPWEPVFSWIQRINATQRISLSIDPLRAIVSLHYRYRFDPHGISTIEREALKSYVQSWLEQHKTTP